MCGQGALCCVRESKDFGSNAVTEQTRSVNICHCSVSFLIDFRVFVLEIPIKMMDKVRT